MRALLLAGGLGTRLRPVTDRIPKCLVAINGRPLLDYWLELLFAAGIERILVNTHWLPDAVRARVAASPWASRVDLVHEPTLLGTGGTVKANLSYFGDADFLVAHADNFTDFDVNAFVAAHAGRPKACEMTMLAFRTDDPRSCGILELDARGIVRAFHEKVANPPHNLANGAVYIFDQRVAARLQSLPRDVIDLSNDIIPTLMDKIFVYETRGYHRDIGSLESLQKAQTRM